MRRGAGTTGRGHSTATEAQRSECGGSGRLENSSSAWFLPELPLGLEATLRAGQLGGPHRLGVVEETVIISRPL